MAKKSSTLPLNLRAPKPRMPLYRWLYEELRSEILAGRLRPGARLPATRDLATQYGISRPTIVTAFEQLRSEGYVEGKVGSGTYVSETLPDELLQAQPAKIRGGHAEAGHSSFRLCAAVAALGSNRVASGAGISSEPAGTRCFSHQPLGAGGGATITAGFRDVASRRRSSWISAASRSGGGVPEYVSRGEVCCGSGVDHLRRAAGAGPHCAPAAGRG